MGHLDNSEEMARRWHTQMAMAAITTQQVAKSDSKSAAITKCGNNGDRGSNGDGDRHSLGTAGEAMAMAAVTTQQVDGASRQQGGYGSRLQNLIQKSAVITKCSSNGDRGSNGDSDRGNLGAGGRRRQASPHELRHWRGCL